MAYRNLNTFGMAGGFNITSGEPIDSRMIVEDINHIYEAGNWTDVKPYNGLIVSSRDGQVRVCINKDDYTNPESWVEISGGMGTEVVNTYEEALPLATEDAIGQIIYVKTETQYPAGEGETYSAGPYIVTGEGTLAKIGTTTSSGDLSSDVADLKGRVGTLETKTTTLEEKVTDAEGDIDTLQSDMTSVKGRLDTAEGKVTALEGKVTTIESEDGGYKNKIESISVAGQDIAPVGKKVSITFEDNIEEDSVVENAPKTKAVAAKLKELKQQITAIPKFNIQVAEAMPETGVPNVPEPSATTVYLVTAAEGDENNLYTEWIYVEDKWEKLGVQKVDLSEYAKTSEVDQKITTAKEELQGKIDAVDAKFANYTDTTTLERDFAKKTEVEEAKTEAKGYTDTQIAAAKVEISSEIDTDVEAMATTLREELATEALTEEEITAAITAGIESLDVLV